MRDIRQLNIDDLKYATFLLEDGQTFMHLAIATSKEANDVLFTLDSFKKFQEDIKASQPEIAPKSEQLSLVAAGYDIFMPVV